MRTPKIAVAAAALALLLSACGDDDDSSATTEVVEDGAGDGSASVPDGVAAVVDGVEIGVDELDEQVDVFAQSPPIAAQLESAGEEAMGFLQAQVLSTLIAVQVVTASAEDLGAPVTDDDIADARVELEEQAGGPDELAALLQEQGVTEGQLSVELRGVAAMRNVEEALGDGDAADADGGEATQEYLADQLRAADVAVGAGYGSWDAASGQVIPPGVEPPS